MADPIAQLHLVLEVCGIVDAATKTNIINQEGFVTVEDLGICENDMDVSDMAKRMALRMQAKGRVLLGTVVVKCLQTLVWWVRDHQKCELDVDAADWTAQVMNEAAQMKSLK